MEPKPEAGGHGSVSVRREELEKGCTLTVVSGDITLQVHVEEIVRLHRDGKDWQGGTAPHQVGRRDDGTGPFLANEHGSAEQGCVGELDRLLVQLT